MEGEFNQTHFVTIDFEHATWSKGSVCSVGIATFNRLGQVIDEYYTLVKPPHNKFEWHLTNVHKINSELTKAAPTFIDVFPEIKKRINNRLVVAHGAFHTDKHCLEQAMELSGIDDILEIEWDCTQRLCDCSLDVACEVINVELNHHEALSDAIACGKIYAKHLIEELPFSEFQKLKNSTKKRKSKPSKLYPEELKGEIYVPDFENAKNRTNPFFKKKVVITGFQNTEKSVVAEELKRLGADIDRGVTKRTNFLIIGPTPGPSKLDKMRRWIEEGNEARIITLEEFNTLKEETTDNRSHLSV